VNALLVVNPLPAALKHYEAALCQTLRLAGYSTEMVALGPSTAEGLSGPSKVTAGIRSVIARTVLGMPGLRRHDLRPLVVLWPLFGYWDIFTWWPASAARPVVIVLHDITPLRPQHGHTRIARWAFGLLGGRTRFRVVCHTADAAAELHRLTGVRSQVASHPLVSPRIVASPAARESRPVIRVLGQFKAARSLEPLHALAAAAADPEWGYRLEIKGRGWPRLPGWAVEDRFLSESEFAAAIASASCVILPYSRFYQSGVAVRCLELGTPVVAPGEQQIRDLFGETWPGIVREENDWVEATLRAASVGRAAVLGLRERALARSVSEWQQSMTGL
jgi:hypothetical protein